MLLGGTVAGSYNSPEEWERLLSASRFKAVTAPFDCHTPRSQAAQYVSAARRQGAVIAEVGVWRNCLDPDPEKAREALRFAKDQLALAEEWGVPCCVNIAGTAGKAGWDAADRSNFTPDTYRRTVSSIREIIDDVQPRRAFYCIEPMPWMIPDGPEVYEQLIRDVGRRQFAAHMDFVNMLNCPRRCLASTAFIGECFERLAPHIRSTHIKDVRMDPTRLTTLIEECPPGQGTLDYVQVLRIIDRWLPDDAPVLLEHMDSAEAYAAAYDYVAKKAAEAGVAI